MAPCRSESGNAHGLSLAEQIKFPRSFVRVTNDLVLSSFSRIYRGLCTAKQRRKSFAIQRYEWKIETDELTARIDPAGRLRTSVFREVHSLGPFHSPVRRASLVAFDRSIASRCVLLAFPQLFECLRSPVQGRRNDCHAIDTSCTLGQGGATSLCREVDPGLDSTGLASLSPMPTCSNIGRSGTCQTSDERNCNTHMQSDKPRIDSSIHFPLSFELAHLIDIISMNHRQIPIIWLILKYLVEYIRPIDERHLNLS